MLRCMPYVATHTESTCVSVGHNNIAIILAIIGNNIAIILAIIGNNIAACIDIFHIDIRYIYVYYYDTYACIYIYIYVCVLQHTQHSCVPSGRVMMAVGIYSHTPHRYLKYLLHVLQHMNLHIYMFATHTIHLRVLGTRYYCRRYGRI